MSLDSYVVRLNSALNSVKSQEVNKVVDLITAIARSGKCIWFMGNGGSAASANHAVIDMLKVFELCGIRAKAHSLVANNSIVTAIANDVSYDEVFAHQIRIMAKAGDLVISISASGNSTNLIRGMEEASRIGCRTLSMNGFDGGVLPQKSDFSLIFRTELGDYGVAEDCHSIFLHFLVEELRSSLSH
jgi:phosphoheptose isomerase